MIQFGTTSWPKVRDGVSAFTARYMNPIWDLIDRRLHALEETRISWLEAVADLTQFGLRRIDDVLAPAFERVGRIATLGFLKANSTTTETLAVDEIATFVITDPDQRELFHPSFFVTLTRPDNQTDFALGRVASYVKATGVLDVEIKLIVGSAGPHSDWEIIAGSGVTIYVKSQADAAKADRILAKQYRDQAVQAAIDTNAAAILIAGGPVSSVNGKAGAVTLSAADVGAMSAADGVALANGINAAVQASLDTQSIAVGAALAAKEAKWGSPAAYNASAALNHQHILVSSAFALDLATTTAAVGDRFRVTVIGSGFAATLNGAGIRFRNVAGAWVQEAFNLNKPNVTAEFVKVSATDWELL